MIFCKECAMYNAEEFFKDFEEDACFHIKEFAEKYTPLSSEKRQACNDFATEFLEKLDFQGDIKKYCRSYFRFYAHRVDDALEVFSIPLFSGESFRAMRLVKLCVSVNILLEEHLFRKNSVPANLCIREHNPDEYCKDLYVLYQELAHELGMLALAHIPQISDAASEELLTVSDDLQLLGNMMPLYLKMINYLEGTEYWR